jgi:hypothetical protein
MKGEFFRRLIGKSIGHGRPIFFDIFAGNVAQISSLRNPLPSELHMLPFPLRFLERWSMFSGGHQSENSST